MKAEGRGYDPIRLRTPTAAYKAAAPAKTRAAFHAEVGPVNPFRKIGFTGPLCLPGRSVGPYTLLIWVPPFSSQS